MNEGNLVRCQQLCREFLRRADELREFEQVRQARTDIGIYGKSRHVAAVRRTSLDLWYALAELRRKD